MSTKVEADAINEAMSDPVPTMSDPPSNHVELMRGIKQSTDLGDVWHTDAVVRELNGADEEFLAALEKKKGLTYSEYMSGLLSRAVLTIGDLDVSKSPAIVDKLILGDRDLLYMGIMRATYGDTREIRTTCTSCNTSNDVVLDLDEDFPIRYPDFDVKDGMKVKTSQGVITLRLPNGEDTVYVQKNSKNDAELNTLMLARCSVWDDDNAPEDAEKWAKELNLADRKKLINALLKVDIGPKMGEVETQCASCEKDMPILLDWVSLLLG
jgi:hypothetical protein